MAEIRPFRGVRYNEQLVGDLSSVICPPYDIITPQTAQELYHRSEYNFVRLEYGRQLPPEASAEERHGGSAAIMERWLEQGILKADEKPSVYLHEHTFSFQGKPCRRLSLTVAVRLTDWNEKIVRPHEATRKKAKSDRLGLLWALGANTSPILTLFDDPRVYSMMDSETGKASTACWETPAGSHRFWVVSDIGVIDKIHTYLADKPLYIADGHHRYESSLNYQRERQTCAGEVSGEEGFNFVMMTLVDFTDPGLVMLSPHRLVRGLSPAVLSEFLPKIEALFTVESRPLDAPDVWPEIDSLLGTASGQLRFVLFGLEPGRFHVLTLRDFEAVRNMMPCFHGDLYLRLGVSVLDHVILEKLLGLGSESEDGALAFDHDERAVLSRVQEQEYQLAFLVSPIRTEMVKIMADAGERMPRKSTYFIPKPPSGLVIHRLD